MFAHWKQKKKSRENWRVSISLGHVALYTYTREGKTFVIALSVKMSNWYRPEKKAKLTIDDGNRDDSTSSSCHMQIQLQIMLYIFN